MAVAAVNLKIPPLWPADPEVWFAQVEAQFATRGITVEKTKFEYIVASLTPDIAVEVRDLILHTPDTTPYTVLKEQLISRTAASEQRRLQQLFNSEDLGDRKPSQLLRKMQQLLGEKLSGTDPGFVRELFLQRLPNHVRMVLASIESKDLESLAQIADKIMEVSLPSVSNVVSNPPTIDRVDQLLSELSDLRKTIETLVAANRPPSSRSRTPSCTRNRSPSPAISNSANSGSVCWYHERFGANAQKCRPPCSHSGNEQAST